MKFTKIILLIAVVTLPLLLAGCELETHTGTITGVVFYVDNETVAPFAYVAVYQSADPDTIYELVQGDEEGIYAVHVPAGDYIALGATLDTGPFTGIDTVFGVINSHTTVKRITIEEEAP
jgi:hypothetical protein